MTVKELYSMVKELMFEKPSSTIYDNSLVGNLNRLLTELFDENNMTRAFNGKPFLTSPQRIPNQNYYDIELEYEDNIVYNVLPLGLAARFEIDDDLSKFSLFNTDYKNARVMNQKLVSKDKVDALNRTTNI